MLLCFCHSRNPFQVTAAFSFWKTFVPLEAPKAASNTGTETQTRFHFNQLIHYLTSAQTPHRAGYPVAPSTLLRHQPSTSPKITQQLYASHPFCSHTLLPHPAPHQPTASTLYAHPLCPHSTLPPVHFHLWLCSTPPQQLPHHSCNLL